jgi:hypothetical protein
LLLDIGRSPSSGNQHLFKFELDWLLHDRFVDMVKEIWESVADEADSMRHWQARIQRVRQHLRGWAKNVKGGGGQKNKRKKDC